MSDFVRVCGTDDVSPGAALAVEVQDTPLAIVHSEGEYFAIYDECSHAEVPLSEGDIEDTTLECWLHGSRFDLRTGKPTGPPATRPVPVYETRVEGGDVLVRIHD